jgi:catechol 2,3-dioxygenase-like lactoylglutathione lyase family enzyme
MPVGTTTIPALPCESLDATLDFWRKLGFEVTYKQRAPNPYAVLRADDSELHFFGLKQLNPQDNYSTCLVIVPEVEQLHRTFAERLRGALGKLPIKGFPRISRMRPGQTRFTLTDVAGNSVIFIKRGVEDEAAAEQYKRADQTPLQRALSVVMRLRDFKGDDAAAARVLDTALGRQHDEATLDLARALVARIELAMVLEEPERAGALRDQLRELPLSEAERQLLSREAVTVDS